MRNSCKFLVLVILCLLWQASLAQSKRLISGSIVDASTKEPLPYVTVSLKKLLIGVVTNEEGKFDLYIPSDLTNDTLFVNYLGYKHYLADINKLSSPVTIKLQSTVVQLEEIVVRPLNPENYIQFAMRKLPANYPSTPFQTVAYYREKTLENNNLIKYDEGIFKTYSANYNDTLAEQHQLMLYRSAENPQQVQFMRKEIKKKQTKDSTKVADGKDTSSTIIDLGNSFGGPDDLLKSGNIRKNKAGFLDTTQFNSFKYSFAKSSSYNTDELMVIDFASKGKVNHLRQTGKIYIDLKSQAIVKIEVAGDMIVPGLAKTILFFMSIGVKNPTYIKRVEFQEVDGIWYPKTIHINLHVILTNNHLFKKDEYADFEIEQFFAVNELKTNGVEPIPLEKRYKESKEMDKQVHNDNNLSWEGLNIIKK
ncbi:hypothetical protein CNR22_14445 [Sphingobacteriaceae bacterium]|nr:hypothetical protein CNR22_14445 [Sphingobacteriaceae bacterium]